MMTLWWAWAMLGAVPVVGVLGYLIGRRGR